MQCTFFLILIINLIIIEILMEILMLTNSISKLYLKYRNWVGSWPITWFFVYCHAENEPVVELEDNFSPKRLFRSKCKHKQKGSSWKAMRELNTWETSFSSIVYISWVMESRITVSCPGDALARLAIDWLCLDTSCHLCLESRIQDASTSI